MKEDQGALQNRWFAQDQGGELTVAAKKEDNADRGIDLVPLAEEQEAPRFARKATR